MTTKEAIDHLIVVLKSDPDYREGWKANIAMAFKDQWAHHGHPVFGENEAARVHRIANSAAVAFLEQLAPLREMPDEIPGGLAVALTHTQG